MPPAHNRPVPGSPPGCPPEKQPDTDMDLCPAFFMPVPPYFGLRFFRSPTFPHNAHDGKGSGSFHGPVSLLPLCHGRSLPFRVSGEQQSRILLPLPAIAHLTFERPDIPLVRHQAAGHSMIFSRSRLSCEAFLPSGECGALCEIKAPALPAHIAPQRLIAHWSARTAKNAPGAPAPQGRGRSGGVQRNTKDARPAPENARRPVSDPSFFGPALLITRRLYSAPNDQA